MDWGQLGMQVGAPIAMGAVQSLMNKRANDKALKAQQEQLEQAIAYLTSQANKPMTDAYGNTVSPNGMDSMLAEIQKKQAELQAVKQARQLAINEAVNPQTDKDAQDKAKLLAVMQNNAANNQQAQNVAPAVMQMGGGRQNLMRLANSIGNKGTMNNAMINAAVGGMKNNNIANYQGDFSGVAKQGMNSATNLANQWNNQQGQYANTIAQLKAGMPTGNGYSRGSAMGSAMLNAAGQGLFNYMTSMDRQANNQALLNAIKSK